MIQSYISPLRVYVIWHPLFEDGGKLGQLLFRNLCRDMDNPLEHRMGIPVFFRSRNVNNQKPIPIPFAEAERNLVICLIDDQMIIDNNFREYVVQIFSECHSKGGRFLPVAFSKNAYNINNDLGTLNFVRCFSNDGNESIFLQAVFHELCKSFQESQGPVKLFISHSKHDQVLKDAIAFRNYVYEQAQVKTFFDANDIGYGDDFAEVIKENAGKCVIVAFVSDTYASREWCRNEIIIAKKNHCPILVVQALSKGESRSFPYLGNLTTRKWEKDNVQILNLALHVALSNYFNKAVLKRQSEFYQLETDAELASYPELFTILTLKQELRKDKKEAGIIIYPDPPLGNEELEHLK